MMKKIILLLFALPFLTISNAQEQYTPIGHLGVESNHIDRAKAEALGFDNQYGAYVTKVIENTAAALNALQPFDYLTGLNGKSFSSDYSFSHAMHTTKAGETATFNLIRDGQPMSVSVVLGKQRDAIYRKIPKEEEPFLGVKQTHYNWKENGPGVQIRIVNNSAAATMGLEDDDIITTINNQQIVDWHDLSTAIDNMEPGDIAEINYLRQGIPNTTEGAIRSYAATYNNSNKHKQGKNNNKNWNKTNQNAKAADDVAIASILENLEIDMEDVTQEEADDMKEKVGIDMPTDNNLRIKNLNIFPNPTSGLFNLTFDLPNNGETAIRIFNGVGRLLYQNDLQNFKGRFEDRIDLSNRPKGIYFIEIRQADKSISKKVIVQ